jgi:ribosomal protein S18 acetylase RimI-like enzyme
MKLFSFQRGESVEGPEGAVKLRIRPYRRGDRRRVLEITRDTFADVCYEALVERAVGPVLGVGWAERKMNGIDSDLGYYARSTFVAEVDGNIIGFVATRLYQQHGTGHVANLAVDPAWQGRGVGRRLMEYALRFFRVSGMKYARVETMENNEKGQRLYPSLGFEEVGRQIHYYMTL